MTSEKPTEEGQNKFNELMTIFKKEHAGVPLSSDY